MSEPEIAGLYAAAMDEARQIMAKVLERSGLEREDAEALSSMELAIFEGKSCCCSESAATRRILRLWSAK